MAQAKKRSGPLLRRTALRRSNRAVSSTKRRIIRAYCRACSGISQIGNCGPLFRERSAPTSRRLKIARRQTALGLSITENVSPSPASTRIYGSDRDLVARLEVGHAVVRRAGRLKVT